jgi:hypothetical protein
MEHREILLRSVMFYEPWKTMDLGEKKASEVRHIVLCHVKTQSVQCPWELRNSWQTTAPIQWDCMPISPACHQASPAQSKHPKTRAQTFLT